MDDALLIHTPLGLPGSGRIRYAAAMRLWSQGALSPDALEVYRILSPHDATDPAALLAERRAKGPPAPATSDPVTAIRTLITESDRYLATLPGPGPAEVRARIGTTREGPVAPRPSTNPVVMAHLPTALAALMPTHPALALALHSAASHLDWITYGDYDPATIGADFLHNHAFATLIGETGTIPATEFDFGIFLIAPHVLYRDRHHAAPELYAPLTGPHGWRFHPGAPLTIKPAHVPVWNDPFRPHMTKVGPTPFLALFGWTADVNIPAMVIPAADWPALESLRLSPDAAS
jgi:hypothetical protein